MTWSNKYKKSIDCNNPKGFSQKAHCQARKLRQMGKPTKSKPVSESKMTSLEKFRAAASQREREAEQRRKEMEARHAQGKEDMKGAIDRLAQRLNKEETINEISINTLSNYTNKAAKDAVHRASTGKGRSLDRFLNIQKAKDKIMKQTPKPKVMQTGVSEEVPVNNVGGGNIAGLGVGPQGEPGVKKKNKLPNFISYIRRNDKK